MSLTDQSDAIEELGMKLFAALIPSYIQTLLLSMFPLQGSLFSHQN